jgi:hypothetical protein
MFRVPEPARITTGPMATRPREGRYGAFLVPSPEPGWALQLICDDGTLAEAHGWEHVSVTARRYDRTRVPTWREMAFVKAECWDPEDVVVQFHPRASEYVNVHQDVLHLWRHRDHPFPTPPANLVG